MPFNGFCVKRTDGPYWTGTSWERFPCQPLVFASGPDPWQDCHQLCLELRKQGHNCIVYANPGRISPRTRKPARVAAAA